MGDPFFKSYYSIFDVPNRRLGLAVSSLAPTGSKITGQTVPPTPGPPTPDAKRSIWNLWTEILIVLLLVLIGLIIGLLCYMRHLKSMNDR